MLIFQGVLMEIDGRIPAPVEVAILSHYF